MRTALEQALKTLLGHGDPFGCWVMKSRSPRHCFLQLGRTFIPTSSFSPHNTGSRAEITTPILLIKRKRAGWKWFAKVSWLVRGRAGLCQILGLSAEV